jgi:hypothetical protein
MIYKVLHKTLKIEQHESHKNGMNPCPPEGLGVRSLYLIPKLHTCPFKQRYIAGLQSYCDYCYLRGGVNQMGF